MSLYITRKKYTCRIETFSLLPHTFLFFPANVCQGTHMFLILTMVSRARNDQEGIFKHNHGFQWPFSSESPNSHWQELQQVASLDESLVWLPRFN